MCSYSHHLETQDLTRDSVPWRSKEQQASPPRDSVPWRSKDRLSCIAQPALGSDDIQGPDELKGLLFLLSLDLLLDLHLLLFLLLLLPLDLFLQELDLCLDLCPFLQHLQEHEEQGLETDVLF